MSKNEYRIGILKNENKEYTINMFVVLENFIEIKGIAMKERELERRELSKNKFHNC